MIQKLCKGRFNFLKFFKFNVRSSYLDLLNEHFHIIQKLCKGDFNFDLVSFFLLYFDIHLVPRFSGKKSTINIGISVIP